MNKNGFTLIEVLVVVIIIGILTSVALPMYTRAIERSRAVEAMSNIKAINDAIYVYNSLKEQCPNRFSQLTVSLPATTSALNTNSITGKYFTFELDSAEAMTIPGTKDSSGSACYGVLAKRNEGDYQYIIYNPYTVAAGNTAFSLKCEPTASSGSTSYKKSYAICESLGLEQ